MNTILQSRYRKRNQPWSQYNRALTQRGSLGLPDWKRAVHYGRSLAESTMHRLERRRWPKAASRQQGNQAHEALLRAHLLNTWATPTSLALLASA